MKPLRVRHITEFEPQSTEAKWLIEGLWLQNGVGLLGGQAKVCKTYLAAEFALAVASGQAVLGCFAVKKQGTVLLFCAEDSPESLRTRFDGLAQTRGLDLKAYPIHLIDEPVLRLDREDERQRLCAAVAHYKPRLLVLDPFVRLVGNIDENSAHDVSSVLGSLRAIQRDCGVAILLIHHARKSAAATPYQAYRGSSDFAAWSDSNLFITRNRKNLTLHAQHRSARSPEPVGIQLVEEPIPHLTCNRLQNGTQNVELPELPPLADQIRYLLDRNKRPMNTTELQQNLRCRRSSVVEAVSLLQHKNIVRRTRSGVEICVQQQQPRIPEK